MKEVLVEPGDPLKLNQQEENLLGLAYDGFGRCEWTALTSAVETILNERLVNKFRIEIEPIGGKRWCRVWHGETLMFEGIESKPEGKPAKKKST